MLGYELDFNSCAIRDGFCKSSHICEIFIYDNRMLSKKGDLRYYCII